jgi:hypothetical protein
LSKFVVAEVLRALDLRALRGLCSSQLALVVLSVAGDSRTFKSLSIIRSVSIMCKSLMSLFHTLDKILESCDDAID